MDVGGAPANFGILDCDCGGADGGTAQEFEVEGLGMRLVLGGEGGVEMEGSG